jgi:hypothetical protein
VGVDFGFIQAEVHVLGGVRLVWSANGVVLTAFVRLGGSISIFGLVTVAVELRVELAYDSGTNVLFGRATLVIEIDVTLYADSVELDSGLWVFAGSSTEELDAARTGAAEADWSAYQEAYG